MHDRRTVQRSATRTHGDAEAAVPGKVTQIAAQGVAGASAPLPFADELRASFGRHAGALDGARAQIGGPATAASEALGAHAYATGDRVAFAAEPDRALVGHEAAHIVQQRGGVQCASVLSAASDDHEQHADEVGAAFARGESAEPILDRMPSGGGAAIQRDASGTSMNNVELVARIYEKGSQLFTLGQRVRSLAAKLHDKGHHLILADDKSLILAAKRLHELADGVHQVWESAEELADHVSSASKLVGDTLDKVGKVLDGLELVANLTDRTALDAFLADPGSYDKAKTWADDVGATFTSAASLIPSDIPGLPSFVTRYLKGLLSAPASYIAAFEAIMDAYIAKVDAASGGKYDGRPHLTNGMDDEWAGPLTRLYMGAPGGLKAFMTSHKTIDGLSLWDADGDIGRGLLISAVQREADDPAPWIAYINAH